MSSARSLIKHYTLLKARHFQWFLIHSDQNQRYRCHLMLSFTEFIGKVIVWNTFEKASIHGEFFVILEMSVTRLSNEPTIKIAHSRTHIELSILTISFNNVVFF